MQAAGSIYLSTVNQAPAFLPREKFERGAAIFTPLFPHTAFYAGQLLRSFQAPIRIGSLIGPGPKQTPWVHFADYGLRVAFYKTE